MTSPRRGEVWLVDLGMAAKVRPALVISIPAEDTDRALVTLVPHTTSPRQSRFEAAVSVAFLRVGVFDAQNLVAMPHAKLFGRWEHSAVLTGDPPQADLVQQALEPSRPPSRVTLSLRRAAQRP